MRLAVYAGTFDPITCGHLSVIERAAPLFEHLVVLVASHPAKSPMFSLEERLLMIRESTAHLSNVSSDATHGLVVSYAREHGAGALIRGIRGATDAEYETELAQINWQLAPEVTTLFVPANPDLAEVSSSELKRLAAAGGDVRRYAPAGVLRRLGAVVGRTLSEDEVPHEPV